jgi:C1A family cysteine protease
MRDLFHQVHYHLFHKENKHGWKKQTPDLRDAKYSVSKPETEKVNLLPPSVDLRSKLPPAWDQGQIGSCTAHGIGAALVFDENFQKETFIMPSRLFIYWNERNAEGSVNEDAGAVIRDGIKVVAKIGFADEKLWPYVPSKFKVKPPASAYDNAVKHKALQYLALDNTNLTELKSCLAAGFPFVFGFTVYSAFESAECAKTGVLTMPKPGEPDLGGHCVCAVGYDDAKKAFIIRNSWGTGWGQNGHFEMPYDYITSSNLASDFWTIRKID